MNYLIVASSILCTLLSIISLYFITTTTLTYLDEYRERQKIKAKLHPEVTIEDIENDKDILTVVFDRVLTDRVMNNEESERQEPIQLMTMDYEEEDEDEDD
jgi:hypothetical protein